jgi:Phage integrase family
MRVGVSPSTVKHFFEISLPGRRTSSKHRRRRRSRVFGAALFLPPYSFMASDARNSVSLECVTISDEEALCIFGLRARVTRCASSPVATEVQRLIHAYVEASKHGEDLEGPSFRPVKNDTTGELRKPLNPKSVYDEVVKHYGKTVGITVDVHGFCVHSLRATAVMNALAHNADIAKVQEWLGHANVSTMRIYHKRRSQPEESPTFKVEY